jgi:hypothetical protein
MNEVYGYGIDSVALAIECKNYKLAKILLIGIADSIQKRSDEYLQQSVLKPIDAIEDTNCQSIRSIFNIERKLIRDKIKDLIRTGKYALTSLEEELIKQEPYLLHEQFICGGGFNDLPNTPLLITILRDQTDISKKLIDLDSKKKSLDITSACYMANNTPLVLALKRGNRELAKRRCCTIPSSLRAALFAAKQSSFSVVMRWHGNLACPAMSFC